MRQDRRRQGRELRLLRERRRDRQLRPSKIQGEALGQAAGWLEDYRSFWDESFDRLEEHLR